MLLTRRTGTAGAGLATRLGVLARGAVTGALTGGAGSAGAARAGHGVLGGSLVAGAVKGGLLAAGALGLLGCEEGFVSRAQTRTGGSVGDTHSELTADASGFALAAAGGGLHNHGGHCGRVCGSGRWEYVDVVLVFGGWRLIGACKRGVAEV